MKLSFEDGNKGYSYGMVAVITFVVNFVLTILELNIFGGLLGVVVFAAGILAYINGKRELKENPGNKNARIGKRIGLAIIVINVVSAVMIFAITGMIISGAL